MQKLFLTLLLLFFSTFQSTTVNGNSYQYEPEKNELALYALSLEGTPYKYGGSSPDTGFDCSGFVGHVFKQSMGKLLPRSSAEISRIGSQLKVNELMPGDLVFYNTLRKRNSHVGIYLGEGQFIHSPSTGRFVSIENMNESIGLNAITAHAV